MARYAAQGVDVHVIIATDGIAGSVEDPKHLRSHDTLAQVRSSELANAALALGLTSIWSLPYRDSGMRGTPENEHPDALIQQPMLALVEELLGYLERLRPQVVLTHDPFGGYGHPDHVRVCEATTAAFYIATGQNSRRNGEDKAGPQKLYYTAFDKLLLNILVWVMPWLGQDPTAFGRNKDINFVDISRWPTPIHARIDVADYVSQKISASEAHASQYGGGPAFIRVLPSFLRQRYLSTDSYTRAYPVPTAAIERDLFDRVV